MQFDKFGAGPDKFVGPFLLAIPGLLQPRQKPQDMSFDKVPLRLMQRIRIGTAGRCVALELAEKVHELKLYAQMVGQFGILAAAQTEMFVIAHQFLE